MAEFSESGRASAPERHEAQTPLGKPRPEDEQCRTESGARSRNNPRRQQSGFERPQKGRPKQVNLEKGIIKENVKSEKGRRNYPQKGPSISTSTAEAEVSGYARRKTSGKEEQKVTKLPITPSSGNEPEVRVHGKYSRKHGQKENPESNDQMSGASGGRKRSNEKPGSHSKPKSNDGVPHRLNKAYNDSPGMLKPLLNSSQGSTGTCNRPFVSHGIVTGGNTFLNW